MSWSMDGCKEKMMKKKTQRCEEEIKMGKGKRDVIQDHGSAEPMVYAVRFNILLHVDL